MICKYDNMMKLLGLFNSRRKNSKIKWNAAAMSFTYDKAQQNYSDIRLKRPRLSEQTAQQTTMCDMSGHGVGVVVKPELHMQPPPCFTFYTLHNFMLSFSVNTVHNVLLKH